MYSFWTEQCHCLLFNYAYNHVLTSVQNVVHPRNDRREKSVAEYLLWGCVKRRDFLFQVAFMGNCFPKRLSFFETVLFSTFHSQHKLALVWSKEMFSRISDIKVPPCIHNLEYSCGRRCLYIDIIFITICFQQLLETVMCLQMSALTLILK